MTYLDQSWQGPPERIAAALAALRAEEAPRLAGHLGPRELDGQAYLTIRSKEAVPLPEGLAPIGPELATLVLGAWA